MKNIITHFFRLIIGALFVFSGFVKLIDPIGSAYKFNDYFAADVLNLEFLIPYSLPFSIFLIILEVMLGIMLLFGYKSKLVTWTTLLLMLVFLFLTWYSWYFDKVKDCGCFGDFMKMTAFETFLKNVVFTPLIIWLVIFHKDIMPIYSRKFARFLTIIFLVIAGFITYHVLTHLPIFDFRPYAIGKNIPAQMIYPEGAAEDVFEDTWVYKINGEDKNFTTEEKPWEIEGAVYVDRKTVLVTEGYSPPIHDFSMELNGKDLTSRLMTEEKLLLIVSYNLDISKKEEFANIKILSEKALNNGYEVYLMSASEQEKFDEIKKEYELDFNMLFCDETTLKTMVRANPGILSINKGNIEGKWSSVDFEDVKIKEGMGRKTTTIDFDLKDQMEKIFFNDQKYRTVIEAENPKERDSLMMVYDIPQDSLGTDFWEKQVKLDSINGTLIDRIISEKGYPGKSLVGELNKDNAWSVIMHSNSVSRHIEAVKIAAENNELSYTKAATMEDFYLMSKGEEQIYGTQTGYINEEVTIWPIKEVEAVNVIRKEAGFGLTVQEYAKELFGADYIFEPSKIEDTKKSNNIESSNK